MFKSSDEPVQKADPLITNKNPEPEETPDPGEPAQLPDTGPGSDLPSGFSYRGKDLPNRPLGKEGEIDEPDEAIIEGEQIAASRSALPWLPIRTRAVKADYKKQLASGDLVVIVRYRGSKKQAENVWNNFLKKYNDPGTAYLVVYEVE